VLIVLVSELEALLAESKRVPGRVARLLERGTETALQVDAFHSQLLTGQAIPAAPLTRRLDCPGNAEGAWLRADPVDFQPDLNAVWVHPEAQLAPGSPVVGELKSLFSESGLYFDLPVPDRGYLQIEAIPECHLEPPWALAGVSLDELMPGGEKARQWRRLLSECQILIHQHRAHDHGGPGGLWFWGAGQLPERHAVEPRVRRVFASDPVLVALSDWLNLPLDSNEAPETFPCEDVLIEWPAQYDHSAEDNLERLDAFLKPAWQRLRLGQLDSIELAGRERAWLTGTRDAWRFWVRRKRATS
jgi:hypothetical protein